MVDISTAAGCDAAALARLEHWLLGDARLLPDIGALVGELALRLRAEDVPVTRLTSHVRTLHPIYRAVMRLWQLGQPVREIRPEHGAERTSTYLGTTVQHVFETGDWLDVRLAPETDAGLSPLGELRAQGLTHYVMAPLVFSTGIVSAVSWATDTAAGFSPAQLGLLRALTRTLGVILELKALTRVSAEVLAAYVGTEPMRRILAGEIRRGDTSLIDAAIFLSDLRGSTAFAERLPGEAMIGLLNRYFDCVVPAVLDQGGEILKFIGDGVLAIFRVDGDAAAARRALAAARQALDAIEEVRIATPAGEERLRMGIALHLGQVAYGNIGARERLDFTVVGSDVNLASRIQDLCSELDEPLLASAAIAPLLGIAADELGEFRLKGIARLQPVWRPRAPDGL